MESDAAFVALDTIETLGVEALRKALEEATINAYLDSDVAISAWVAVEVLLAALGLAEEQKAKELGEAASRITGAASLLNPAKAALQRVLDPNNNEMHDLMQDADLLDSWIERIRYAKRRLENAGAPSTSVNSA